MHRRVKLFLSRRCTVTVTTVMPLSLVYLTSLMPILPCVRAINALFRLQVEQFLARSIIIGSLTLTRDDEPPRLFGETVDQACHANHPVASLHLANPTSFYARVATQADIGFAEAFIARDFLVKEPDHLATIFRMLILNRDQCSLSMPSTLFSRLGACLNYIAHLLNRNTLSRSRRNIHAHYDLSNELFQTFLGSTWTYSCAIFEPGRTLDDAQIAKIDLILQKARVESSHHLLDIGAGWGELAIRAATTFGCQVTGITLSSEQLVLARHRAHKMGLSHKVSFELIDYRQMALKGDKFDRIVSVEMVEAVGHEYLGLYFSTIDRMLNADGLAVIQVITTPEPRYDAYRRGTDFIQKHIFPGGLCPSLNALISAMASSSSLIVEHVENIGVHYATTLKEWRRRFLESVQNGDVKRAGFDDIFIRKWIYYLCYCESGFATRTLGTVQMVLTRIGNVASLGGAPVCS